MKRWVIALVIASLLGGCTALRLAYRQADTLLSWRANHYFDLEPQQKHAFDVRLQRLLVWHRHEQLPDYAAFISSAVERMWPGLKPEHVTWAIDGAKERYKVLVERGVADAAELLGTLSPEQITNLQKQWAKDNRKFVREHELEGTLAERKRARLKRTVEQIEDWTGNLSSDQQQKIAQLLEPIPLLDHLRYKDRLRRQQEFVDVLKIRANRQEFQPRLRAWLLDWERGRTPEYDKLWREVYERRVSFYVAVDKLLTASQRQHVADRIKRFVEDFRTLSARS